MWLGPLPDIGHELATHLRKRAILYHALLLYRMKTHVLSVRGKAPLEVITCGFPDSRESGFLVRNNPGP